MKEKGEKTQFVVRDFDPATDLEAVYECYVSGFHHCLWPLIDHAEKRFTLDTILYCHRISDVSIVAEADGEARGLLMGFFPTEWKVISRAAMESVRFNLKVATRRYRMKPLARKAYWQGVKGNLSYIFPYLTGKVGAAAEILLLTSLEEYRGGVGRAMMDRWVEEVKRKGHKYTTVGTDTTVNWRFYERYGFERVCEFPLKSFKYSLPGVIVRGYIYRLDLE